MKLVGKIFKGLWFGVNFSRKFIINLVFFGLLIAIIISISESEKPITVPSKAVLKLDLNGFLVEELTYIDPVDSAIADATGSNDMPKELLVDDVLKVLKHASTDDRIQVLYLNLDGFFKAHLDKLRVVAQAIDEFKATGKRVIAHSAYYSQSQYYLAAHADTISLHPYGGVKISGFSTYPLYFKDALEKLKVTQHVFRVGTYKSAVEPFLRNDMSPAAKQANQLWLNELWSQYKADVANARGFSINNFDDTAQAYIDKLAASDGDFAKYALNNLWVDELQTDQEVQSMLTELVGENASGKSYSKITFNNYLASLNSPLNLHPSAKDKVAIVVARGTIKDGKQKAGTIGGDSTAALLKRARLNDSVKAIVLRIDSGGGSMFASETIRNEVLALKEAGKPVIASMGSVAASGGYWIAASADEIWASPSTITGSIGVFGTVLTFENSLKSLGIHSDGVSTSDLTSPSIARGISPQMSQVYQMSVENAYDKFISLVASERNLAKSEVDKVAQGRVWTATQAIEFGLIDKLGNKQAAVDAAANLASLSDYDVITIKQKLSEKELFLQELLGTSAAHAVLATLPQQPNVAIYLNNILGSVGEQIFENAKVLSNFNDPNGLYTQCLTCQITD